MFKNLGSADRLIRTITALVVFVLVITNVLTGAAAIILGILAAVLIFTAFAGFCPIYYVLKLSSLGKNKRIPEA